MAIREEIELDYQSYVKSIKKVERAHSASINEMREHLKYLKKQRDKSNDPAAIRSYNREIQDLTREVKTLGGQTEEAGKKSESFLKRIGVSAKLWIAGAAYGAFRLLRKGLSLTQEVEATASKFETVLGPSINKANRFLEENARMMGLTDTEGKELVATTTAIAQGFGFVGSKAADLGLEVVKLAADLQSFNDVPIERTHRAITSALSGETEALKSLGIVIRQEMVTQRALENTGKRSVETLTQQERATATLALITEKAGMAVGDLERTQRDADNRARRLMASIRGIAESLSSRLSPALEAGLNLLEPLVNTISDWVEIPLSDELKIERIELNSLVMQITNANISQEERNRLIGNLQREYPDFLKNLDAEKVTNEQLSERLDIINKQYANRIVVQEQAEKVAKAVADRDRAMIDVQDERIKVDDELRKVMERFGYEIDLSNKSTEERINLVREALRAEAEFGKGRDYMIKANEQAKALIALEQNTAGYSFALQDLRAVEKDLTDVEERRQQVFEALGLTTEEVNEAMILNGQLQDESKEHTEEWIDIQQQALETVTLLGEKFGSFSDTLPEAFSKKAISEVELYNQELTKLNNELSAGVITQKEFEERANALTSTFLNRLQQIYKTIKDQLTPAQQKLFKQLFGNFKKSSDEVSSNLESIADAASSVLNLADAFGEVDRQTRTALRGIIDIVRNVDKLKGASGLAALVPALGIGAGIASVVAGFVGSSDTGQVRQRELELVNEMKSLRRAITRNTDALLQQAIVGAGVSQSQLSGARASVGALTSFRSSGQFRALMDMGFPTKGIESNIARQFIQSGIQDWINQLEESGLPGLENASEEFWTLLDSIAGENISFDELDQALRMFEQSVGDRIDAIDKNLGQFGESLEGAIERLNMTTKLGGDQQQAFDTFIQEVIGLIGNVSDRGIVNLLKEVAKANTTEERRALANDIWKAFQDNPALIGSELTGSALQEIIDVILSQESAMSDSGIARSTQIARTITDVQANEVIYFLERIEHWTRLTAANMGDPTAIKVTANPNLSLPKMQIPIPLPVKVTNSYELGDMSPVADMGGGGVQIGSVNISGPASDAAIEEYGREFTRQLKREVRARQF